MRSDKEIEDEIALLHDLAERIPQEDGFGDSNRAKIDAQIEALEERMDEDDVEEAFPIDDDADINCDAYDAVQWMEGADDDKPSDQWKALAK